MTKKSTKLLTALLVSSMLCATPSVAFAQDSTTMPSDETSIAGTLPSDLEILDETLPETTEPEVPEMEVPEAAALEVETPEVAATHTITPFNASARSYGYGQWCYTNGRWWFRLLDGSYPYSGIYEIDGVPYAFDASGWMVTGWYSDGYDWYYFDSDGSMHFGWLYLSGSWYYLDVTEGWMYSHGFWDIGDTSYCFYASGAMVTGWYWDSSYSEWYYFDSDGSGHNGWLLSGGSWYLIDDGWMFYDDIVHTPDNMLYFLKSDGKLENRPGWHKYHWDDTWFYVKDYSGALATGWLYNGGNWYYLEPEWGEMYADGVYDIDGIYNEFDENGVWLGYVEAN